MVKRLEDWPKRLSSFLDERRDMPFEWGKNDCLTFLAKGAESMTGNDYYSKYAGYNSEDGANEKLKEHGGIVKIIESYFGAGIRNPLKAHRGDIALIKAPEITAGIVDDSGRYVAVVTKEGLRRFPLEKAWRIWRF